MATHDITTFMQWWIASVYNLFIDLFNMLDSIQFGGITLLEFILAITVLGALLPVFLTIPIGMRAMSERIPRSEKSDNVNYGVYKSRIENGKGRW